ncbi:proteasome protein [[Mycobacterium] wendilense]|uniref:Proteasome protein n=1 Tax=[Mycobacterium] wendilense TaxID=3064284 RepID=A0ABM9MGD2_9MYCO|nr:proteasome protein [Mycolicibacterium sp. MU0050]CAJ1584446.1 proteasome protein [Mycolicibacterium sp. MU0050]
MTVVIALRCVDGVVMGSDSQITDPGRGLTYPDQKLHPLGKRAAWGGSGSRAVLYDLEQLFGAEPESILEADDVGRALQARAVPVLNHHYENFIEKVPAQESSGATPATYLLAAGYTRDQPFIVDIDPHGLIGHHEDTGFQAIGSGAPMAQQAYTLMENFNMSDREVNYGLLGVLRVLDALAVASPSVGGPMDLCRITPDGAHHLSPDEVAEVRDQVSRWKDREQRALDGLFD